MKIDLHIHTYYSYDCLMMPEKIIKVAKSRGLTGIAICDHNTIQGGVECKKVNEDDNFNIIIAAEIATEVGDVTGLYLKNEITSRKFSDVVYEIKSQNGIVLLNHPFKAHKLEKIDFDKIDLIEGYNSRLSLKKNMMAVKLAKEKNKPVVAGSDAHLYCEIGNCQTIYNSDNLFFPIRTEYRRNVFYAEIFSQLIKVKKNKDVKLFLRLLKWSPKYILKRVFEE